MTWDGIVISARRKDKPAVAEADCGGVSKFRVGGFRRNPLPGVGDAGPHWLQLCRVRNRSTAIQA